jgi:hypothetical protein
MVWSFRSQASLLLGVVLCLGKEFKFPSSSGLDLKEMHQTFSTFLMLAPGHKNLQISKTREPILGGESLV